MPNVRDADDSNFPNAKDEDLNKIIEEETKEDFSAVQQLSKTMTFKKPPVRELQNSDNEGEERSEAEAAESNQLVHIQGTAFNQFEGVSLNALNSINEQEAEK